VFSGEGLFGRIASVTERTSQVLVLQDINSRIPVEVGTMRRPALLAGDGTEWPRLVYLRAIDIINVGDEVVTSGASGEFPRGLNVGRVKSVGDGVRVRTDARGVAGSYLTVLRYELPSAVEQSTTNRTLPEADNMVAGRPRGAVQ
jgi:rod shape-determining protein MreC